MPTAGHARSSKEIFTMEGALIYGFFQKAKRIFLDLEYDTFTHPQSMATQSTYLYFLLTESK